jgi:hypothetical protein
LADLLDDRYGVIIAAALAELGEPAASVGLAFAGLVSIATACFFILALHFARISVFVGDQTGAIGAYLSGIKFVARNPLGSGVLLALFGILTACAYAAYLAFTWAFPAMTGRTVLALIVVQQAVMLARSAFQVGLVAGEIRLYWAARSPSPPPSIPLSEPTPSDAIQIDVTAPHPPTQTTADDEG